MASLPVAERAILKKCLDKDEKKRYQDFSDLKVDLERLQGNQEEQRLGKSGLKGLRRLWRILTGEMI